jgi:quercetin dioxygenase-like cupin family protein
MSVFDNLNAIAPQRVWDGVLGRVVHGERLTIAFVELEPHSVVPEHSHDNEQVGVLLRGTLRFRVRDEAQELGPGGTWTIPANAPHEVVTGPEGAVLVETFAPPRDDWRALEREQPRPLVL